MPSDSRYWTAAPRPTASAIGMVPASNFHGTSFHFDPVSLTSQIISPPPRHGLELQLAARGDRNEAQLDPAFGLEKLPRHQVRVVLHLGEHDRVARGELRAAPRMGDQVERLGAVAREDALARRGGVDEAR